MQVATQAIAHMPTLLLFPLVPFVLEVALVFWWVFVAAYLYSSGMRMHTCACMLLQPSLAFLQQPASIAVMPCDNQHASACVC
jgi:choline transporter-like protein 2/4/5